MKIKILRSISSATDGSHPLMMEGEIVDLKQDTAEMLVNAGIASLVEEKPAVKVVNKPKPRKGAVK